VFSSKFWWEIAKAHTSSVRGGLIYPLHAAMTALLPMWDKPAGRYLTSSRSTNRLSGVPTLLLLLNLPSAVATPLLGMSP